MRTISITTASIATVMLLMGMCDLVSGQGPSFGRPGRPTTSPYLNLLRRGDNFSPTLNYYQSYRPQVEFRANERALGQSIRGLQREIEQIPQTEQKANSYLGTTGHPTSFHSTESYFPSRR